MNMGVARNMAALVEEETALSASVFLRRDRGVNQDHWDHRDQ